MFTRRRSSKRSAKIGVPPVSKFHAKYTLDKKKILGRGTSAIVFEGVEKETGKKVAVKVFKPSHVSSKTARYLRREIGALRRVDHPNVVKLYDAYESGKTVYVVTEKVSGRELFDCILERQKYTEEDAKKIVRQVASALDACHDIGVIHRDLKPENILIEDDTDIAKLIDFGFCTYVEDTAAFGAATTNLGTEGYWAPEVRFGKKYNKSCDVWSLGVIAYILLSGFHPFLIVGKTIGACREALRKGQYTLHGPGWESVSQPARELISQMLQLNPLERITLQEVLRSPWLRDSRVAPPKLLSISNQLSNWSMSFSSFRKISMDSYHSEDSMFEWDE